MRILAEQLSTGQITRWEFVQHYLDKIEREDGETQAFLHVDRGRSAKGRSRIG